MIRKLLLVGTLFGGDASSLVRRLVAEETLSDSDLRQIQQMIDERLKR